MPENAEAAGNRRRRYMTTPAQDALIREEGEERKLVMKKVFVAITIILAGCLCAFQPGLARTN